MKHLTIHSVQELDDVLSEWSGKTVVDVETYSKLWLPDFKVLGIGLSPEWYSGDTNACYIPFNTFQDGIWCDVRDPLILLRTLGALNASEGLIGHNRVYDKYVLDTLGWDTKWHACTRIMWHLASAPAGPRPYGLKDAQVELLGWPAKGDLELRANVKAKGGSVDKGDHYLADLEVLAHYACLDTHSTMLLYKKLEPFFKQHDYWDMLHMMMEYDDLLYQNTFNGVRVDRVGLQKAHNRLEKTRDAAQKRFLKEAGNEISELERDWADRRIAGYKREYNRTRYANHPEEWERFNLNSDPHKRELFYDKLGNTPTTLTEAGKASTKADDIKWINHPSVEAYLKYEHVNTLVSNFSSGYLESSMADSRLHPGFNICGTISYRLSGFKPYLLNAPFEEKRVLRHLQVEPGYIGVHADLSAIEPTITAHYSEDKSLLKVFRDGRGDIYLDLALQLFPDDKELKDGYNPNIPITKATKDRFERQRKIAKVIQLAVQYTGTGHTVSKNLTKEGVQTSVEQANTYVRAYWQKFSAVRRFNYQLKETNKKQGHLRNVIGRIIRVPDPEYKDLSNRFIQSSAHDVLILWVLEIYRLCKEQGICIKPILLDCHDSTSNQVPIGSESAAKDIYKTALDNINRQLDLCVVIKAEIKIFKTLAGLKNNE